MRFLTTPECEELVVQVGIDRRDLLAGKRVYKLKATADFFYQSRMKDARPVADHLVAHLGDFAWAMLWVYGLLLGDHSREENAPDAWQRYVRWRRSAGDDRALYEDLWRQFTGLHPSAPVPLPAAPALPSCHGART